VGGGVWVWGGGARPPTPNPPLPNPQSPIPNCSITNKKRNKY